MLTFEDLKARGEAALHDAKTNELQESLTLDFKSQSGGSEGKLFADGKLTREGKASLAKALSAFSNSAGGLIVFGVNCRPVDGVDRVQDLEPISNWQRAYSDVSSAVGDLLQPRNELIDVQGFPSDQGGDLGYIAVNVPRSERRPHRSEASGQKQYYKRSGAASYAMEHYDIEDAFARRVAPALSIHHEWSTLTRGSGPEGIEASVLLAILVANNGSASAKHVTMTLRHGQSATLGLGQHMVEGNDVSSANGMVTYSAPSDYVIHPGQTRSFQRFMFVIRKSHDGTIWISNVRSTSAILSCRFDVYSESAQPTGRDLELTPADFSAAFRDL